LVTSSIALLESKSFELITSSIALLESKSCELIASTSVDYIVVPEFRLQSQRSHMYHFQLKSRLRDSRSIVQVN